jgi:hypothetical protein
MQVIDWLFFHLSGQTRWLIPAMPAASADQQLDGSFLSAA